MIQRVQSIFMFLAAVAMIAMSFFPLWVKADLETGEIVTMTAFEIKYEQENSETKERQLLASQNILYLSIGAFLAGGIMLYSLSRYKNRMTQVKLNALFSLLCALILVGLVLNMTKANQLIHPEFSGQYKLGFFLPIVGMFNNFLANRFIRKDEALVRSADRIR
ncbi:MAG: DUF4293 domain-containing protein [Cyclobacteriaceae bacterium]